MLWEPKREEIRSRRTMMGLSMSGLSKKAGLSVSSVLRIESEITKKSFGFTRSRDSESS